MKYKNKKLYKDIQEHFYIRNTRLLYIELLQKSLYSKLYDYFSFEKLNIGWFHLYNLDCRVGIKVDMSYSFDIYSIHHLHLHEDTFLNNKNDLESILNNLIEDIFQKSKISIEGVKNEI